MNGKDLVLVIAGSMVFGGLAGAAGAMLVAPHAGQADPGQDDLGEQVAKLERALDDTRVELKQSDRARDHLEERLTKAELRVAGLLEASGDASHGTRTLNGVAIADGPDDGVRSDIEPPSKDDAVREEAVRRHLVDLKTLALGDVKARLEKFKLAAQFRALPEEERWTKLQEDLRLTDPQVYEIKDALAERGEGLKAARTETTSEIETSLGGSPVKLVMANIDPEKSKEANDRFKKRVDDVLNEDQRKAWDDKGYDQALGSGRGGLSFRRSTSSGGTDGGSTDISIGVISTSSTPGTPSPSATGRK